MNDLSTEILNLPSLVSRAADQLAEAKTSAEVPVGLRFLVGLQFLVGLRFLGALPRPAQEGKEAVRIRV